MIAGASPVVSYRTLDLPILVELTAIADRLPRTTPEASALLEALYG